MVMHVVCVVCNLLYVVVCFSYIVHELRMVVVRGCIAYCMVFCVRLVCNVNALCMLVVCLLHASCICVYAVCMFV